jgi:hypothetical protein
VTPKIRPPENVFGNVKVIADPAVPPGTVYLIPSNARVKRDADGTPRFVDEWGDPIAANRFGMIRNVGSQS